MSGKTPRHFAGSISPRTTAKPAHYRSRRSPNISYYAVKAARSGRRSYYTGRSDVLSPGCQLDGNARHDWLDDEVEMEDGETGSIHDLISPFDDHHREADPAEEAARNLD